MSLQLYRSKLARLLSDIADIDRKIGQERTRAAAKSAEISRLGESLLRTKNLSSVQAKTRQIETKEREKNRILGVIADLEKKKAVKAKEQHSVEKRIADESVNHRKRESEAVKRDQTARLQRERAISAEIRRQHFLKSLPSKILVVFCAADPYENDRLFLDEEVRDIQQKIRMSAYRDCVDLESRWAMRTADFMQTMNELKPHVVHFSGHGAEDGTVIFVADDRTPHPVSIDAVVQMVKATSENLRVVVFNSCFSEGQAEAVVKCVEAAIGMKREISDEAAREFAAQFYSAIGFGKSIGKAFDQGIAALAAKYPAEQDTPTIFGGTGVDLYSTALVEPDRRMDPSLVTPIADYSDNVASLT